MRKISVKNGDGEECNFKNWGYLENRPDHYVTCTKDYYSKNRIGDSVKKTAQFPYCPMNVAGKWSYCLGRFKCSLQVKTNFEQQGILNVSKNIYSKCHKDCLCKKKSRI